MSFILSDNLGSEKTLSDTTTLRAFLRHPSQYWKEGTGDSSVAIKEEERLLFFKVGEAVFIMQLPDYISPMIDSDKTGKQVHFVGGEAMEIPEKFLCSEETAFDILAIYVEKGEFDNRFGWVEI